MSLNDSSSDEDIVAVSTVGKFRKPPKVLDSDDDDVYESPILTDDDDSFDDDVSTPNLPRTSSADVVQDSLEEALGDSLQENACSKDNGKGESAAAIGEDIVEDSHSDVEYSFHDYINDTSQIAEVSSDEDVVVAPEVVAVSKVYVNQTKYQEQQEKIRTTEAELQRAKNAIRVIRFEHLPDKGKSLIDKEKALMDKLREEKELLANMVVKVSIAWDEIQAGVEDVAPRTLGKIGVAQFKAEKHMAVETLDELHNSLQTCPTEKDMVEDPAGLKVKLMVHQRRGLAWLLWREKQKPSGGILADDMGLGKTLTMISLIIKSREQASDSDDDDDSDKDDEEEKSSKYPGGTLVVCPASLINQWDGEIQKHTKRGLLDVEVYHGSKREERSRKLARHDVVITTYGLVLSESEKSGTLLGVRWRRLILDEAHQIRNHKSRTAEAVCRISARSKWALTGTPVHNKELDMYALMKFLRCSPFDNLRVWKHWMGDKSTGATQRLHTVISSLMLRRTKAELMEKKVLASLPERTWQLMPVKLDAEEMDVYHKVLVFSRTLFAQFLYQRAEKNQDAALGVTSSFSNNPNSEYFKMRNKLLKINRIKEVSQHEILVLLLRLRQICCHPSLITGMLQGDEDLGNAENQEECEELDLLGQLGKLTLADEDADSPGDLASNSVPLSEASKGYLNSNNPVFNKDRRSSKIKVLINVLRENVPHKDKVIIISQWTTLLQLVGAQLKVERIPYDSLDGSIPVYKRMPIVDNFNNPNSDTKVLLLSLTAGGVGLNLVGANHLFLLDLHWNPQLENQAQDRIYRVGQNKPIFVYKFMAVDTIEERIKQLQEKKLDIADSMLTGSKRVTNSKLTLNDLKMLFDFK